MLNVTPDHLDRYPDLASYAAAKARIFARCDTAVINLDDPLVVAMPRAASRILGFSLRASIGADYAVAERGRAMVADPCPGAAAGGVGDEDHGPAQRGQRPGRAGARRGPGAAAAGDAGRAGELHRAAAPLAVGGRDRRRQPTSMTPRAPMSARRSRRWRHGRTAGGDRRRRWQEPGLRAAGGGLPRQGAPRGADRPRCAAAGAGAARGLHGRVRRSLPEAVRAAARAARPGDTVLLSPACASLDMFRDYAHRGEVFAAASGSWRHERQQRLTHGLRALHRQGRLGAPRSGDHRPGARHRAARPGHGDLRLDVGRRAGERPAVLLPRAPAAAHPDRRGLRGAGVLRAHRGARARLAAAAGRRDRSADRGAGAGPRPLGQRQPALAAAGGRELPGLGTGARAGADLGGELRGAPRGGAARDLRRAGEAAGPAVFIAALLLVEPDFGAATVLFATGFGLLFLAGARLRYVIAMTAIALAGFGVLAVSSSYRMRRLTAFLDPWADPFNSGFQLTQSLIAIGRGQWFGVGLGESVQKLFYLPEAHTDFLFAVLAEELGLVGVVLTLALFLALVWRSFYIARLATSAGLKFQAYLAAGFGLWIGIQAFINIGVNMGVLPTKGLTLPLMSYGRSSLIVALAWVGLLLRVYHEAMREQRGSATVRGAA